MITREQALTLDSFHAVGSTNSTKCNVWRRNGATRTWKTRPNDYSVPVKFGLYSYNCITQDHNPTRVFAPADCPACHGTKH